MKKPCVFRKVNVQQGVNANEYCVSWILADERYLDGQVFVYRSVDASNWGDPINEVPVIGSTFYIDRDVQLPSNDDTVFYRLTLFKDGLYHDSPIGGLYQDMTELQQGLARAALNLELKEMRDLENGYRVLLYKPLLRGDRCPDCQQVEYDLPTQTSRCPTCYGTRIVGGFADPVETYVRKLDGLVIARPDQSGGAGIDDTNQGQFRGLAFPLLRPRDVIVIPSNSQRWTIGVVRPVLFRDILPIAVNFDALSMSNDDIRQNLPSNV